MGALEPSAPSRGLVPGTPPVLELKHVSKVFAGTRALDDVNLTVNAGEIHGLLGENGSGKSTLIKVLAGYHSPDAGAECRISGLPVKLPIPPAEVRGLGLSFVHQTLGLVPSLTVLENLRLSDWATSSARWINWRMEEEKAREVFARFGMTLEPRMRVSDLDPTERAMLAIVRAVEGIRFILASEDSRGLLVLDEPTVFLPPQGVERLFALLREVVERHASVLLVSHDLEEIERITDRVTVLRDGRVRGSATTRSIGKAALIEMIVGREVSTGRTAGRAGGAKKPLLSVESLTGPLARDVSFDIRAGEVLGLTGVLGSGYVDVLYHLFGSRPCSRGALVRNGQRIDIPSLSPGAAIRLGIALVPGDRDREGSVGSLSVGENMMLQVMGRFERWGVLRRQAMNAAAEQVMERFDVRPREAGKTYQLLSGGNQQKALLAKWVQIEPEIFLMHEPTQGVDIGARTEIFKVIKELAARGCSIVCASSDHEQLATICDRVLIFAEGRVSAQVEGERIGRSEIMARVYGLEHGGRRSEVWI